MKKREKASKNLITKENQVTFFTCRHKFFLGPTEMDFSNEKHKILLDSSVHYLTAQLKTKKCDSNN